MGSLRPSGVFFFKFELFSSKDVSEEFFRRILKVSVKENEVPTEKNIGKGIKTAVFVPTAVPWFCR